MGSFAHLKIYFRYSMEDVLGLGGQYMFKKYKEASKQFCSTKYVQILFVCNDYDYHIILDLIKMAFIVVQVSAGLLPQL